MFSSYFHFFRNIQLYTPHCTASQSQNLTSTLMLTTRYIWRSSFSNHENEMLKFTIHTHAHTKSHHHISMHLLRQSIKSNTEKKLKQIKRLKELQTSHCVSRSRNATATTLIESVRLTVLLMPTYIHMVIERRVTTLVRRKMLKTPAESYKKCSLACTLD